MFYNINHDTQLDEDAAVDLSVMWLLSIFEGHFSHFALLFEQIFCLIWGARSKALPALELLLTNPRTGIDASHILNRQQIEAIFKGKGKPNADMVAKNIKPAEAFEALKAQMHHALKVDKKRPLNKESPVGIRAAAAMRWPWDTDIAFKHSKLQLDPAIQVSICKELVAARYRPLLFNEVIALFCSSLHSVMQENAKVKQMMNSKGRTIHSKNWAWWDRIVLQAGDWMETPGWMENLADPDFMNAQL